MTFKEKFRYYRKLLAMPIVLLIVLVSVYAIWEIFNLPPAEVFAEQAGRWFNDYGLIIVFLVAILEGMLLIGGYFPGVFIIFISVITASSFPEAALRIAIGTLGLFLGHVFNYGLGRYGWYRLLARLGATSSIEEAREKLPRQGLPAALFGSYWLPSMGAFADTAAGILRLPFKRFVLFSLLASVCWNFLVGTILYFMGEKALPLTTSDGPQALLIQFGIVVLWAVIILVIDFWRSKKNSHAPLQ